MYKGMTTDPKGYAVISVDCEIRISASWGEIIFPAVQRQPE
jgi:hypothetical protein